MGTPNHRIMSPLRHLDTAEVSRQAAVESRKRERVVPSVSVFRWWARRTHTVVAAVLAAIENDREGRLLVCDPFAGGGTVALQAIRRGHRIYAQDIDPWAANGLVAMLTPLDPAKLEVARDRLHALVQPLLKQAYGTTLADGTTPAVVTNTLRVATAECLSCGAQLRLFPHALVSLMRRVDRGGRRAWLACPSGHLQVGDSASPCACGECGMNIDPAVKYTAGRLACCPHCGARATVAELANGGLQWEVALIQRTSPTRREISPPSERELRQATTGWLKNHALGIIPAARETQVLLNHGFRSWDDCYPSRQRAVLATLFEQLPLATVDPRTRHALGLALAGAGEMAGLLSRWDRRYLKSYEAMAGHRFSFTTLPCEPNVWGANLAGRGTVRRRIDALVKSAIWYSSEVGRVRIDGPIASTRRRYRLPAKLDGRVVRGSASRIILPDRSVDVIWTDPPYHDDVQYDQLSMPLRAWATLPSGILPESAVARTPSDSGYGRSLKRIFLECNRVLKSDGHLLLSFANREPNAWIALFTSLRAAGFRPCGYEVVHSENELDHVKKGVRACTMDILLDLVRDDSKQRISLHRPRALPTDDQARFLYDIGSIFVKATSKDATDWQAELRSLFRKSPFGNRRPAA